MNILDSAKVRIVFDIILFASLLTGIIGIYTLYLGQFSIAIRAFVSLVIMMGLLFFSKSRGQITTTVHILLSLSCLSVLSNVFIVIQEVDYSTIALFFVNVIFGFYFLSIRTGFIYLIIQAIGILVVMFLNYEGIQWTSFQPEVITPPEQALAFFVVLVLIIYMLIQFHRANNQFSSHLTESNLMLKEARDSADEMSRLKTHFLANMSHEIRTPINGIIGLSELIGEATQNQEVKKMADMQLESSRRLLNTITSILKLSKMEAEGERIELKKLDINYLVNSTVKLLKPLADKKGIELKSTFKKSDISCYATEDIMYQIMNNIIGNGIKFTDEGSVEISTDQNENNVEIQVVDTGIGISEDFLPKIFNAFEQESRGFNRDFEGSGLGLSISKRYIELLGGELIVQSEKGKGTTFKIRLPHHH